MGDVMQVPFRKLTNFRRHCTKSICPGRLASKIRAPLDLDHLSVLDKVTLK